LLAVQDIGLLEGAANGEGAGTLLALEVVDWVFTGPKLLNDGLGSCEPVVASVDPLWGPKKPVAPRSVWVDCCGCGGLGKEKELGAGKPAVDSEGLTGLEVRGAREAGL
jgi:hypothetical protein